MGLTDRGGTVTDQSRIDRMEGVVEQIGERITSVENRLISLESTLEGSLNSRLNTLTIVVLGNVTATILAAIGVVVAVLQVG